MLYFQIVLKIVFTGKDKEWITEVLSAHCQNASFSRSNQLKTINAMLGAAAVCLYGMR